MQYAVNHNAKNLEIYLTAEVIFEDESYVYPSCIFTCCTLENLSIHGPHVYPPEVVCLNRLKKLKINRLSFDAVHLKILLSGCPLLEDLKFDACHFTDCDISSNSLKKLKIYFCLFLGARLRVSVSSLQLLKFGDNGICGIQVLLENLPSLTRASFQTEDTNERFRNNEHEYEPIPSIRPKCAVAPTDELSKLGIFPKLEKLELFGLKMHKDFAAVKHFMDHSPNLKLLELSKDFFPGHAILKMAFGCPHFNTCIIIKCGEDNNKIADLLDDYYSNICDCGQE